MLVLIVSDTHGNLRNLKGVIKKVQPDQILHLGDVERQEVDIEAIAPCPVRFVRGNCDFYSTSPDFQVIELGKHFVYMCHGHLVRVGYDESQLAATAKAYGCDTALYGHTHVPQNTRYQGITVVNPGSITQPRQDGRRPTFCVCDVDPAGDLHFTVNYIKPDGSFATF